MLGVMRQEALRGSVLWRAEGETHSAQWTRNPKAQQCQVRDGLSHWPVLVSCFHLGHCLVRGKNHRLSISAGLCESLVALCLFFCRTKEWKGVFPQPVRRPSQRSPPKPPHLSAPLLNTYVFSLLFFYRSRVAT